MIDKKFHDLLQQAADLAASHSDNNHKMAASLLYGIMGAYNAGKCKILADHLVPVVKKMRDDIIGSQYN